MRRKIIAGLVSLLCLFLVLLLGLSLFSYSFSDASLNNFSTDTEGILFNNWLGYGGAVVSDLLLQTLGLVSFLILLFPLGWSWRLYKDGSIDTFLWRFTTILVTLLLMTFVFDGINWSFSFPELPNSSGGIIGMYISRMTLGIREGFNDNYIRLVLFVVSMIGVLYGLAISFKEWMSLVELLSHKLLWFLSYMGRHLTLLFLSTGRLIKERQAKPAISSLSEGLGANRDIPDMPQLIIKDEEEDSDEKIVESVGEATLETVELEATEEFDVGNEEMVEESKHAGVRGFFSKILEGKSNEQDGDGEGSEREQDMSLEEELIDESEGTATGILTESRVDQKETVESSESDRDIELSASEDGDYKLPTLRLLKESSLDDLKTLENKESSRERSDQLVKVLGEFGVHGEICSQPSSGPLVTLYEFKPGPGTRARKVTDLAEDVARSISVESVRMATMPGRNSIAVEIPNDKRQLVKISSLIRSEEYENNQMKLPLILGCDIGGGAEIVDLAVMPHLLIAGTTGSGKSVGLNVMIMSLLYRYTPSECKFIMIDPKMLELSVYSDIPHLLTSVVTDSKKAVVALKWAVKEMESRYYKMSQVGVRNIDGYNKRAKELGNSPFVKKIREGFDENGELIEREEVIEMEHLPYIVVIVDEMADLMLVAGKEIESLIQRLAQMARAAGIHIIMATQRPSVDVVTGTIKANFPTRISFMVSSKIDSRTVLGEQGAEQLLGRGDMLFMSGGGKTRRIHGPFIEDSEVESVCQYLRQQGLPDYEKMLLEENLESDTLGSNSGEKDELFGEALLIVQSNQRASTSFLQRHLQIGYNRAARVMEQLEAEGVVSAPDNVGKREVLIEKE